MQNSTQQKMEVCATASGLFMNGPTHRWKKNFFFPLKKWENLNAKLCAAEDGGLCPRLWAFYERSHLQMKENFYLFLTRMELFSFIHLEDRAVKYVNVCRFNTSFFNGYTSVPSEGF